MRRRHFDVGTTPPNGVFGLFIADDKFILGRATCMLAGLDDQRAVFSHYALAVDERILDQLRRPEVAMQHRVGCNTLLFEGNI